MPRLPPTTPFLPRLNHPTDESLLLASPAFDDITLDDSDFWAVPPTGRSLVPRTPSAAGPSRFPPATSTVLPCPTAPSQEGTPFPLGPSYSGSKLSGAGKVGGDFTLDLDAYLPVDVDDSVFIEEDTILVGQGQRLSAGHREAEARAEGSYFDISSGSLKREGGDTPMRTWTKPKKARPPTPFRDDFYARRLSDTNRRGSFSTARPVASPMLPILHLRTGSSSSSLRRMSVFSSTGLSEGDTLCAMDGATGSGQSRMGRMEMDVMHNNTAPLLSSSLPSSSLSGSLSSLHCANHPPSPSILESLLGATDAPDPASDAQPSANVDPIRPLHIPDMAPSSASASKSTMSTSMSLLRRSLSLNLSTSTTSPPAPDVAGQSPLRDEETSSTPSRRESAGDKVLGFITGLMKRSSSGLLGSKEVQPTAASPAVEVRPSTTQSFLTTENSATATSSSLDFRADSTPTTLPSTSSSAGRPQAPAPAPPRFRGPYVAPLTRPISPPRATASRALKPARIISSTGPSTSSISLTSTIGSKNRPVTTSAFVSAALKRLPPAGKGSTAAGNPVQVRATERAPDLSSRRDVFERLASGSSTRQHRPTTYVPPPPPPPRKTASLPRTVPIRGHTPGKASLARAKEREKFDAAVKSRHEAKEREKSGNGE